MRDGRGLDGRQQERGEFIMKKREMFLVQMSWIRSEEIRKREAQMKEQALKKSN